MRNLKMKRWRKIWVWDDIKPKTITSKGFLIIHRKKILGDWKLEADSTTVLKDHPDKRITELLGTGNGKPTAS